MRPNVSKFKVYEESTKQDKYWSNYADENVLLRTYELKNWTDLTEPVIQYLSTSKPGLTDKRTPLTDFLKGSGRTRQVDTEYIKWTMLGTGEVQAVSMENLEAGNPWPGRQGSKFKLQLDVDWYQVGDVLAPGVAKEIQVVIVSAAESDGDIFNTYEVQLVSRNPNSFFPPELLEPNLVWLKIDSVYGEASSDYGSTVFPGQSYIEFETTMTDYGKEVTVTNKAHDVNLRIESCDHKGARLRDLPDQVISLMEGRMLVESRWEKELRAFYGRSGGRHLMDQSSGYHRRIGPGLLEFLEDGNVIPYPLEGGSIDYFVDWLRRIWFDRIAPGQRKIVFYTGEGGLSQVQDWIAEKFGGSSIQTDFNTFVGKGGKTYGDGYEGLVYQTAYFTEIQLFPFGRIRFEHWPILDSEWLNGYVRHPKTGLPLSSYQYIALDYGLGDGGGSNIEMLQKTDAEVWTHICGTWSPIGPINSRAGRTSYVATDSKRAYKLVHADTYGLRVKDITLTAWFRPNANF